MEKIKFIRNPLTVIAIFAGIAEISGTSVLPFISSEHQGVFIWFVMIFPVFLLLLFFATLNFNHKVLYSPSDYRDDESFLIVMEQGQNRVSAKFEKDRDELHQITQAIDGGQVLDSNAFESSDEYHNKELLKRTVRGTYFLAEELVLNKLSSEFKGNFFRQVVIKTDYSTFMFDAVVNDVKNSTITIIEVKYFKDSSVDKAMLVNSVRKIGHYYQWLPGLDRRKIKIVLAVATDAPIAMHDQMKSEIANLLTNFDLPLDIRIFDLKSLEKELDV